MPLEVIFEYKDLTELSENKELVTKHYDGFNKVKEIECEESEEECDVDI